MTQNAYCQTRTLEDNPDSYATKIVGEISVVDYREGDRESTIRFEMLMRVWRSRTSWSYEPRLDYARGTLTGSFSPGDWLNLRKELGVILVNNKDARWPTEIEAILNMPDMRRTDADETPRYTMRQLGTDPR